MERSAGSSEGATSLRLRPDGERSCVLCHHAAHTWMSQCPELVLRNDWDRLLYDTGFGDVKSRDFGGLSQREELIVMMGKLDRMGMSRSVTRTSALVVSSLDAELYERESDSWDPPRSTSASRRHLRRPCRVLGGSSEVILA
jgi:hypothetical protein